MSAIRIKIIAAVILTSGLISAAAIVTGQFFTVYRLETTIKADLEAMADMADRLLSVEISLLESDVKNAAWYLHTAPGDTEEFHRVLEGQLELRPYFLALTVIQGPNNTGETWEENAGIADSAGILPVNPQYIANENVRLAHTGKSVVSTTRLVEDNLVLYVHVPLDGGRVLSATIDGIYFAKTIEGITIWETGHIFVVDSEGTVLANPRPSWVQERRNFITLAETDSRYSSVAQAVSTIIKGGTGIVTYDIDGAGRYGAHRPVSGSPTGWALCVVAVNDEGPLSDVRQGVVLMSLVLLALCIAAAFLVSGFLEKPYRVAHEMVAAVKYQEHFLATTNAVADTMLRSSPERFSEDLQNTMAVVAKSIDVDRIRIYINTPSETGGDIEGILTYEWLQAVDAQELDDVKQFSYRQSGQSCWDALSRGKILNTLTRDRPVSERAWLEKHRVVSFLMAPLFVRNEFYGFAVLYDCDKERVFTAEEENLLISACSLWSNAKEQNDLIRDLVAANANALAATEAKSRFLANMSHEMRTPLNAVVGFSELLLSSDTLEKEEKENVTKIYNSGVILLGLVNDLLDLSKIESGKLEIIPVVYDVPSLINDTITLNSVRIASKPISFHLHIDETLPATLKGDDLRLKQLFNNVLSNAFKYTKKGMVDWTITCRRDGDSVWLTSVIKDTGIGIRSEDLEKLFSDYSQVNTKSNRKIEGTGLGLSITRRISQLMDGGITVESEYGAGSTFTITIRQEYVNDHTIGNEVAERLMNFRYTETKPDRRAKRVRKPCPYAKVLLVDDVSINLDVAKGLLKPYGIQVDCLSSGQEAIDRVKEGTVQYDAIFMDHMMPEMDGIEAVRIIRNEIGSEYAKTVPIIALTANAIVGNEGMFLSSGFQAFLSKPIDIRALDAAVERWVRDKEKDKELAARGGEEARADTDRDAAPENVSVYEKLAANLDVKGIDTRKGLANFGGDAESYWNVLGSFAAATPSLLEKLRGLESGKLVDYAIVVHGAKGASRNIGATDLGAEAEALEMAAKKGDAGFVSENSGKFIARAEELTAALAQALEKAAAENQKPLKDAPDSGQLTALKTACESFDMDGIDAAMAQLESYRYQSGGDFVTWLREQVDLAEFSAIAERIG